MKQLVNGDPYGKILLQGYDPVTFHSVDKAVKGNPIILAGHQGHIFLFSSKENRAIFKKQAEHYLPAYGGFCAFGVSLGVLFPVEIDTWEIIDGRLVLQFSRELKQLFNGRRDENFRKADENWLQMEAASRKRDVPIISGPISRGTVSMGRSLWKPLFH